MIHPENTLDFIMTNLGTDFLSTSDENSSLPQSGCASWDQDVPQHLSNDFFFQDDSEPPLKRLAIVEEREENKYDYETTLRCWSCDPLDGKLLPQVATTPDVRICLSLSC